MRREPLVSDADSLMNAVLAADGDKLMRYAVSDEIAASRLDAQKLTAVFERLVLPRIQKFENLGVSLRGLNDPVSYATAELKLRKADGTIHSFVTIVQATEKGGQQLLLYSALAQAWYLDHIADNGDPVSLKQAMLKGLPKDRAYLEQIGIPGFYFGPQKGFRTWDECLDAITESKAGEAAKPQGS